ncbi:MAG: hypothetical protein KGD60_10755 [Candidatus Thorarchaeota archaeon]|nr:hypothetical protein [Candidatus Thorarchaeota archaeon]
MSDSAEARGKALSELGQNLIHTYTEQFSRVLQMYLPEGEFDVTGWNKLAVEVAIDVCTIQNRVFRFKSKDKFYSVVKFPEGPMRDLFVREVMGEPW